MHISEEKKSRVLCAQGNVVIIIHDSNGNHNVIWVNYERFIIEYVFILRLFLVTYMHGYRDTHITFTKMSKRVNS